MTSVLISLLAMLRGVVRSRAALHLEVLALRHQLHVLQRSRPRRLPLANADRWLWAWLSRSWSRWRTALDVSQATVAKYIGRRATKPPSKTWRTFLANHFQQIAAADFFVVPTATCQLLFVLVILAHERRRVVHVAVIDHPTAAWTAQQLREAFPWDEAPRYLVHDRDSAFHGWTTTAAALGIQEVLTAPRSPWPNAYAERLSGPFGASASTTSSSPMRVDCAARWARTST